MLSRLFSLRRLRVSGLFAATAAWLPSLIGYASAASAQVQPADAEDEAGDALPRYLTPDEERYLLEHPFTPSDRAVVAPTGPVRCLAEYEPMQAILMSWNGSTSWNGILAQMAARITHEGDADVYVMVDNGSDENDARTRITSAGADMARVRFYQVTLDSIWIRDYGPRYIYEGDCRAIIDHKYNRPRPRDDAQPVFWSGVRNQARYDIPLTHGGGNFHLDALGHSFVTRLINNENLDKTEQQIHDLWQQFQNVDTTFFDPFDRTIDSTQHIDMWVQVIADDAIIVSDWPNNSGSQQDRICDGAGTALAGRGYRIFRTPARSVNGIHYTYTNVVMCNDLVLIPLYTNGSVQQHNAEALAVYQQALPDKTIVQINSESIVSAAGVLHCIVMHMPEPPGGRNPTVYLKNLRGGETLSPGQQVDILWISDDDEVVTSVDILLSTDGGQTFDTPIVDATAPDGLFTWTVPNISTAAGRLRMVVHDADGRSGEDESDSDLLICGGGDCPCGGGEQIKKARCRLTAGPTKLTVVLAGGRPGDSFDVTVSDGQHAAGIVDERGKGKARFTGVPLEGGSVTAEWGCGASDSTGFTCP